jgi:hypothetical protein
MEMTNNSTYITVGEKFPWRQTILLPKKFDSLYYKNKFLKGPKIKVD